MRLNRARSYTKLLLASTCVLAFFAVGQARSLRWKVFSNHAGWSISYPPGWRVASCHGCSDPSAPGISVDFFAPETDDGWVKVDRLQDKPAGKTADAWFEEIKGEMNLNPRIEETRVTVDSLPALRVLYRDPTGNGSEIEEVYVLADSQAFAVTFSSTKAGTPLSSLANYPVYQQMLDSFRAK